MYNIILFLLIFINNTTKKPISNKIVKETILIYKEKEDSLGYLFERLSITDNNKIFRKKYYIRIVNLPKYFDYIDSNVSFFDSFIMENNFINKGISDTFLIIGKKGIFRKDSSPFIKFSAKKYSIKLDVRKIFDLTKKVYLNNKTKTIKGIIYDFTFIDPSTSHSQYSYDYLLNYWIIEYRYPTYMGKVNVYKLMESKKQRVKITSF